MSLRSHLALPLAVAALAVLAACGNNGSGVTTGTPPPTGAFSKSNLNGTYVFSISGTDNIVGAPYAALGVFTANGSGSISGGAIDMNDAAFPSSSPVISPVANAAITSGSYTVGADGRGQASLSVTTPLGSSIVLDFVLQDSSHGLVTQFDGGATGSGTLDVQTAGVTPTGAYAFLLAGGTTSGSLYGAAGNFTVSGNSLSGLADVNSGGIIAYTDQALSGSFAVGPSSTPSTTFSSSNLGGTFDVIPIDASHLKFIELDANATLSGDAFSQSSTSFPAGNLAFTMAGCSPCGSSTSAAPLALGGFMVSDGNGNITNSSTEDYNVGGNLSTTSGTFSATYTGGTGRFVIGNFASFVGGTSYAAYPSSGGLLLMEIDSNGFSMGAASAQQSGATFASGEGYGLNLTGSNLLSGFSGSSLVEVDDIAEFTAKSGGTLTGVIDENFESVLAGGGGPNYGLALSSGQYTAPDSNGRGSLSSAAGNSNNSTLEGGFNLVYYAVDGTTFPFIELDSTQFAVGVMVKQNASASAKAAAQAHMFVLPRVVAGHPMSMTKKWR